MRTAQSCFLHKEGIRRPLQTSATDPKAAGMAEQHSCFGVEANVTETLSSSGGICAPEMKLTLRFQRWRSAPMCTTHHKTRLFCDVLAEPVNQSLCPKQCSLVRYVMPVGTKEMQCRKLLGLWSWREGAICQPSSKKKAHRHLAAACTSMSVKRRKMRLRLGSPECFARQHADPRSLLKLLWIHALTRVNPTSEE